MKILNRDCDYNLHTHTCYCDGKGTPAEIAVEARKLGFRMLGFSGHEYAPHDLDACMSPESTKQYNLEIEELKSLYQGVMEIHRGIERDYFGGPNGYTYDYVIGSVHYVQKNGVFICVDDTPEILAEGVEKHYGGDWMAMVEDYYALVGDVRRRMDLGNGRKARGHNGTRQRIYRCRRRYYCRRSRAYTTRHRFLQ